MDSKEKDVSLKQSGRRGLLKLGAALAGLAMGGLSSASGQASSSEVAEDHLLNRYAYGRRSHFETSVRIPDHSFGTDPFATDKDPWHGIRGEVPTRTPLQDSVGIITPNSLHFNTQKGNVPPDIDPQQHRLMIHGLVDRPLILTLEDLKRLPSVSRIHFVECGGNAGEGLGGKTAQEVLGKVGCCEWTGVLLSVLLREAGVQKGASWLVAEGAEASKLTRSIPLKKAMYDTIVAYGQNGEAVRPENGYPLRLVVPGFQGNVNIKWLRRIKVVDGPYMTKYETIVYGHPLPGGLTRWFQLQMPPKSVIIFPSGGQRLPGPGFYEIRGLAWSGGGAVRKAEISTDGGKSWKDAELEQPVHRIAFTQFRLPWNWNGEEVVLQSRCTDEVGQIQPTLAQMSELWHVAPDYFQKTYASAYSAPKRPVPIAMPENLNPIQPWRVTREGNVENALFS